MKTMSKMLNLGYGLEDVVKSVTVHVRDILKLKEQGTFEMGTRADVTIFKLLEQEEKVVDSMGETLTCARILHPHMTLRKGEVVFKNG